MKIISQNKEITWYLVEEWTTRAGLRARVHQAVWNHRPSHLLHDWYTGYVQVPYDVTIDESKIEVHGGITFGPKEMEGEDGIWAGFDMNHFGDEYIKDPLYAKIECENLAEQIKS